MARRRLRDGDFQARLAASASAPAIAGLPLCLVLTGIPWRTTWTHRERNYRHLFWDAGAMDRLGVRETSDLVAVDGLGGRY